VVAVDLSSSVTGVDALLLPGDVNNDNVIDLDDLSLFFDAYGTDPTLSGWDENADLNCDGVIDLEDLSSGVSIAGNAGCMSASERSSIRGQSTCAPASIGSGRLSNLRWKSETSATRAIAAKTSSPSLLPTELS
jgi:hypothetical protein